MQLKNFPFYPFAFVIVSVLSDFFFNIAFVDISDLLLPIIILLIVITVMFSFFYYLFRDLHKSALLSFFGFFWYILYYNLIFTLNTSTGFIFTQGTFNYINLFLLLAIGLFTLIIIWIIIVKIKINLPHFTKRLNVIATVLIILFLALIIGFYITISILPNENYGDFSEKDFFNNSDVISSSRDIYFIIPDAYGESGMLRQEYGFHNEKFVTFLQEKGFRMINSSKSNYDSTSKSLAATSNMAYHQNPDSGYALLDRIIFNRNLVELSYLKKIEENKVMKFLKSKGYQIIIIESEFDKNYVPDFNYADTIIQIPRNHFSLTEFQSATLKIPVTVFDNVIHNDQSKTKRDFADTTLSNLSEITHISGKKFVFVHLTITHPPYVYGPLRDATSSEKYSNLSVDTLTYLESINVTNSKLEPVISQIIENSNPKPIIILQADHGPHIATTFYQGMSIFNALYLPDYTADERLYDNMTQIQTFPLIFNYYFNTSYPRLEDKSYYKGSRNVNGIPLPSNISIAE